MPWVASGVFPGGLRKPQSEAEVPVPRSASPSPGEALVYRRGESSGHRPATVRVGQGYGTGLADEPIVKCSLRAREHGVAPCGLVSVRLTGSPLPGKRGGDLRRELHGLT